MKNKTKQRKTKAESEVTINKVISNYGYRVRSYTDKEINNFIKFDAKQKLKTN